MSVCVTLYWAFEIFVKSCVVWLVKENNDLCVKISVNAYRMCGMESRLYSHTLRLCVIPFVCLGLNFWWVSFHLFWMGSFFCQSTAALSWICSHSDRFIWAISTTWSCVISGFFKSFLYDLAVFRSHLFQPEEKNEIILSLLRFKRRHIRQTTDNLQSLQRWMKKSLLATSAVLKYCLC